MAQIGFNMETFAVGSSGPIRVLENLEPMLSDLQSFAPDAAQSFRDAILLKGQYLQKANAVRIMLANHVAANAIMTAPPSQLASAAKLAKGYAAKLKVTADEVNPHVQAKLKAASEGAESMEASATATPPVAGGQSASASVGSAADVKGDGQTARHAPKRRRKS